MIWSENAIAGLSRLRRFLADKSPSASQRAISEIRRALKILDQHPAVGRPVAGAVGDVRELIVRFGHYGYIVRYRNDDGETTILAVRHQREAG